VTIEESLLGVEIHRSHGDLHPRLPVLPHADREHHAAIDLVIEQPIEIRRRIHGGAVDCHEVLPGCNGSRQRRRSKRQHFRDLQPAAQLVLERIEAQPEPAG
jgi:hypothetical protein